MNSYICSQNLMHLALCFQQSEAVVINNLFTHQTVTILVLRIAEIIENVAFKL